MAEEILGLDFEIHGGGSDLVFPHHENEIAQTEAARGKPLARLWMHNGMVRLEGEKMAKSVGNIFLLHEALDQAGRDALVMYFVSGHYRQPIAYSEDALAEAAASVERIRDFARRLDPDAPAEGIEPYAERFFDALADDFNTPAARAALFDWIAEGNRRLDAGESARRGRAGRDAAGARAGEPARRRGGGGPRGRAAAGRARGGARGARLRDRRREARRARRAGLGRCATPRRGRSSSARG